MASMSGEKLQSLRPWRPKLHFLFKAATDNNSFSQKINKVPLISKFHKFKKSYLNNSNPDLYNSSNLDDDAMSVFDNVDEMQAEFLQMNIARVEEILADLNEHLDN